MRYVQGKDREQSTLFPALFDDYVTENNPVRFIDYFADNELDFVELDFTHCEPKDTGRMPYSPADLLKLYIYGYLNRIRSSRRLETETHRNVELMWLIRSLRPDHKTIADFRKDNKKAIRNVCRAFTLLCREKGLFSLEFFAIDGSKFSAVANNGKAFTKDKLEKLVKKIDQHVDEYLETLDQNDDDEKEVAKPTAEQLQQKIKELKERRKLYESYQKRLEESGETQLVLTDSDSRLMRTGHNGWDVCYNVQIAVDKKHKLIAEFDVTNDGNDFHQLLNMTNKLKTSFELDSFGCAADTGYFQKDDIKECIDNSIDCYVPEPQKSHNRKKGQFTNKDFQYNPDDDSYTCPAGHKLDKRETSVRKGRKEFFYRTSGCKNCPIRLKCTSSKAGRYIRRWEHEHIIEQMQQKLEENPQYMQDRRNMAEHPFGTIKQAFGYSHFLCKGLNKVQTEMSLAVLAYNMRRVFNIKGAKELIPT